MQLNKHYFIVKGLGVVFSNYPTFLLILVVAQSSIDSQAIGELCFYHVEGPKLASLKLHIVFSWVF